MSSGPTSGSNIQSAAMPRVAITGTGHYFPETILDNKFFSELDIGSDGTWIEDRIGIRERRSILSQAELKDLRHGRITRKELVASGRIMTIPDMVQQPWIATSQRADLTARNINVDLVIAGTSIPDDDIPAHACSIADKHGISCNAAFDINSACSMFVVQLHTARALIRSGQAENAALFMAERYTTRVDYADRKTCVLFGDSSSAAFIEKIDGSNPPKGKTIEIVDTAVWSAPQGCRQIRMPNGEFFNQDGQAVQKFAVQKTISGAAEMLKRNSLNAEDIAYFIGHQANLRMLSMVATKLGMKPEQHLYNVDLCGNQGATGASSVFSTHWDKYKSGDLIILSVVGSGLTWGAALLKVL